MDYTKYLRNNDKAEFIMNIEGLGDEIMNIIDLS